MRYKLCLYYFLASMVIHSDAELIEIILEALDLYLRDAKSNVRQVARVAFVRLKMICPP